MTMSTESRQDLLERLKQKANLMRYKTMTTLQAAGSGHVGGTMSLAEILTVLYFHVLRVDPNNPKWPDRDRFVLSKGHASAILCPVLAEAGFFSSNLLNTFNQLDSPFSMHPDMLKIPGVEMSTGSLGHGLAVGLGMALAARLKKQDYKTYVLMGDGELCEGSVWESAMAAVCFSADNLVAVVDRNQLMVDGPTCVFLDTDSLSQKWRAFGWACRDIDGHSVEALVDAFSAVPFEKGRPSVIIANTVKGKGLPFAENRVDWHYHAVDQELVDQCRAILGVDEP
jgi:transketolase